MGKTYTEPTITYFGSVAALTASGYKCTPGADSGFAISGNPAIRDSYGVLRDANTGEVVDEDGCVHVGFNNLSNG